MPTLQELVNNPSSFEDRIFITNLYKTTNDENFKRGDPVKKEIINASNKDQLNRIRKSINDKKQRYKASETLQEVSKKTVENTAKQFQQQAIIVQSKKEPCESTTIPCKEEVVSTHTYAINSVPVTTSSEIVIEYGPSGRRTFYKRVNGKTTSMTVKEINNTLCQMGPEYCNRISDVKVESKPDMLKITTLVYT